MGWDNQTTFSYCSFSWILSLDTSFFLVLFNIHNTTTLSLLLHTFQEGVQDLHSGPGNLLAATNTGEQTWGTTTEPVRPSPINANQSHPFWKCGTKYLVNYRGITCFTNINTALKIWTVASVLCEQWLSYTLELLNSHRTIVAIISHLLSPLCRPCWPQCSPVP